jgi:Protein of unknown function (DUF3592)
MRSPTRSSSAVLACCSVVLLLALGVGAITYARVLHDAFVASADWVAVDARIAASDIVPASCGKGGDKYKLALSYLYTVGGHPYRGERIWFGDPFCGNWNEVRTLAAQWPAGARVNAFVDPARPGFSVLVRNAVSPNTTGPATVIALVLGALVAGALYRMLRKVPARGPSPPHPGGGF